MTRIRFLAPTSAALLLVLATGARADRDTPVEPPAPPAAPSEAVEAVPTVAGISGDRVNLRVGPRIDSRAVAQLSDGTLLLVVERIGEWVAVRVPQGFPAAVHSALVEEAGADGVRVTGTNVNLRVHPPEDGSSAGAPFRDRPAKGSLLTVLSRQDDWYWVLAPEETRVYVHSRYVREIGPLADHASGIEAARALRTRQVEMLSAARRGQIMEAAGMELRRTMGEIQEALHRHRSEASLDKAPVVALAARLDEWIEIGALAPPRVLAVAKALREDLEAEIRRTVARQDAELARVRGQKEVAVPSPAPKVETVEVVGTLRFEPAPGWRDGGLYLLWVGDTPRYALRLATAGEAPPPDLKAHADGKERRVVGSQPGDRLFGFPAIDVREVRLP